MDAPQRVIDRIKSRIVITEDGCWHWPGATAQGYGRISWSRGGNQMVWAAVHRVMYTHEVGPIPEGLDLDHTCHDPATCEGPVQCRHRRCCNPAHLEPVPHQENLLRGGTVAADRKSRTHCPQGHEYTAANTRVDKIGRRQCYTCILEHNRRYYAKNQERRREYNRQYRARKRAEA